MKRKIKMKRKISVVLAMILVFVAIFSGVPLKHASASVTGTADKTVSAAVIKGDKGADGIWFKTDQADDLAYDTTKIGYADFETKNVGLIGDGCVNEYWADADSIFITDALGAKSGEIVQVDGNKKLKVTVTNPTNVALGMGLFGLEMDNTPRYRGSMEATIQADFVSSSQSSTISITAGGEKTTVILDDTGCYTGKIEIADMAVEVLSDSTSSPWICPYAIRPVIQIDDTSVISSLTVTIDNFSVYEKRYVATFEQKSTGLIGDGWDDGNTILQFATDRAEIVEEDGDKKLTIPFETLFDICMGMDLFGAPMTEEEYGAIMDISVSADFAEGQTPCESTISILKDDVEWKEIGKIQLNQEGTYSGTVKLSEIGFKKPSTENTSPWICPYAVRMLFSIDDRILLSGATVTIDNFELIPADREDTRVSSFEGGIYQNEKQVSGAILSKVAGDEYFIDLSQTNAKPKEGMQVVLDGIFGTDSYKVRFDKNVFEFRDGAWSIVKETDIQLNVQKVMNVTDTNGIWFKSNQADELAYNISEIGCVDFEAKNVGEIGDGCANEYWAGADSIFITDSLGAKGGKIVQVDGNKKLQVTVTNPTNIALGMGLFGLEMDNTPRYRGSMEATIQADFVSSSQNSTISVTAGGEKTTVTLDDTGCYTGKVELADVAVERLSGDDAGGIWWCPYAIRPVIQIDDTSVVSSLTVTIDNFTVYEKGYVATFESEKTGSLGDGWKDGKTILTNDTAQSEIIEMDGNKKLMVPFSQFTTIQMGMGIFGAPMAEAAYSATVDVSISADFAEGQTAKASTISVFDNTWNWSQIGILQLDSEGIYSGTLELSQVPMRQPSSETTSPYICPYAVTLAFNIDDCTLLSGATVTIDNFELIPPDRDTTRPDAILGGVYQGGELLSDMQLKKVAEDEYFIDLNQAGIVPVEGTQIVLDGIYEKDDYQVMFYMTTFEYENGAWNIKVLHGDANNDEKFDVKDLVRMKKYMTHPSRNRISMTNADWNSDGAIDETDAALTRESLIEKKTLLMGPM